MENEQGKENIGQYIARMEKFENMVRVGFACSKSQSSQLQKLPREMTMFLENRPAQIHLEFPRLRGWPLGIEPLFAKKVLYRAFLDASSDPWVIASSMRDGVYLDKMNPADLVKRWHGTGAIEVLHERVGALKFGDIIDVREKCGGVVPAYDARIRSNFDNNPNRQEVYFSGTTHVAIGFNDFSSLLTATIRDELENDQPLKFVGFEMSEFAVAKCKVVAQMLVSPDVSISSVMEVWLSSTWSETTFSTFQKSVITVLESLRGRTENPKMISCLRHWASAETISATKARSEFFWNLKRNNKRVLPGLRCFCREIDRLDLSQ